MHRSLAAQLLVLLAAVLVSTPIPGATPRATSHGAGDVYFYEDHPATRPSGALTIEAWVRVESQEGEAWLVAKGGAAGWRLGLRDRAPFIAGGAVSFTAPGPLPLRQWCHVAGVWGADGSLSIVVDGKLAGTSGPRPGNAVPTPEGPLAIGDAGGDGAIREYALDEVRLWTVARDVKDIGNGRFGEVRSAEGLLAAFPLGGGREAIHGLLGSLSGTSTITPCGILPSSLEVPFAAAPPVLDGVIVPLEYRRPEEAVLRYHDPTAPGDAVVRLVHGATDLFVAVEGLRMPAEAGAAPAFWVAIEPGPGTPFALQIELTQGAERFYRRDGNGAFVPCTGGDCPRPEDLEAKLSDECKGGVCTMTLELRLAKTLLGDAGEIGIAIAHVGYRQGEKEIWSWTATPGGADTSRPETWARALLAPESPGAVEPGGERAFLDVTAAGLPRFCELFECPERRFGERDPAADPAPGFALFVDFYEFRIIHPAGTPYFRPGDWELRVEDPLGNVPGLPLTLTEFREEPLGGTNDLIGDGVGEGVKLFFSAPPDLWEVIRDRKLDVFLTNQTSATERDLAYPVRALSLSERGTEVCPTHEEPWWVHVFIQRENLYSSESPFFEGMTREIHVLGGVGEKPPVTFYVAIASKLPEEEAEDYRVLAWELSARLEGTIDMINATLAGTLVDHADFAIMRDQLPPDVINFHTGEPQGQGLISAVVPDIDGVQEPSEAGPLPLVGTSTVLAVTVRTSQPLCRTCVFSGELVWQDGMRWQSPQTGTLSQRFNNNLSIAGDTYFFCSLVGVKVTFRPGWTPAVVPLPGGPPLTIPGLDLSDAPAICEIIECPPFDSGSGAAKPDVAPDPDFEPGFSLFFPLTDLGIRHPAGVPFFQPGDWDLRVWDPDGKITPLHLSAIREDLIDRGSGIVGDEPGEGVVLFFSFPPGFAESATGANLHLDVANRTLGTPREGSYRLDAIGYGAMPRQGSSGSFRRGDSNGDAEVDLSDALRTLGYLFLGAPPPDCPDAADANDDARIDISDAVGTLGFLFLGSAAPPPPGPFECGADPTGDALGACAPCPGA